MAAFGGDCGPPDRLADPLVFELLEAEELSVVEVVEAWSAEGEPVGCSVVGLLVG